MCSGFYFGPVENVKFHLQTILSLLVSTIKPTNIDESYHNDADH